MVNKYENAKLTCGWYIMEHFTAVLICIALTNSINLFSIYYNYNFLMAGPTS